MATMPTRNFDGERLGQRHLAGRQRHGRLYLRWRRRRHRNRRKRRRQFMAGDRGVAPLAAGNQPKRGTGNNTLYVSAFTRHHPCYDFRHSNVGNGHERHVDGGPVRGILLNRDGRRHLGFDRCGHGEHLQPRRQDVRGLQFDRKVERGHDADRQRCQRRMVDGERIGYRTPCKRATAQATVLMLEAGPTS